MRVKGGTVRRRKHNKILSKTKGYRMTRSRLYRVAHESYMHAGQYSFNDRKKRLGQMRRLWISRISAAANQNGLKYSELMKKLKDSKSELNKKTLAEIAFKYPESFSSIVKSL